MILHSAGPDFRLSLKFPHCRGLHLSVITVNSLHLRCLGVCDAEFLLSNLQIYIIIQVYNLMSFELSGFFFLQSVLHLTFVLPTECAGAMKQKIPETCSVKYGS